MSISLLGSINVCKVNTGWANKIQSDRFENPSNLLCPLWNGQDNFGRFVHPDSYYTKNAGCNSADDRIAVENFLRPQYMEYVALDAAGFQAPLYGGNRVVEGYAPPANSIMFTADARQTNQDAFNRYNIVGSAGYDYSATNTATDFGLRGVSGNPNGPGCGRRNTVENFVQDTRQNYSHNSQLANSHIQAYKTGCTMHHAGF